MILYVYLTKIESHLRKSGVPTRDLWRLFLVSNWNTIIKLMFELSNGNLEKMGLVVI